MRTDGHVQRLAGVDRQGRGGPPAEAADASLQSDITALGAARDDVHAAHTTGNDEGDQDTGRVEDAGRGLCRRERPRPSAHRGETRDDDHPATEHDPPWFPDSAEIYRESLVTSLIAVAASRTARSVA